MTKHVSQIGARPMPLKQLPLRLHHHAIVVRDQASTRHFMEDILGLPLVATWIESTKMPEAEEPIAYCHTFFALADGSCIAFFQFDNPEYERRVLPNGGPEIPRFDHIAIKSTRATIEEVARRLEAAGVKYRVTNHGYCKSIYVTTPDGLYLEFAEDPPDAEELSAKAKANAHADLDRWLAGGREPNNPYRSRDF
ncbi:MAG TPA: VOC family protein [Bradyrhizobium sp.]|nr:VOC family protein [Bradyrhizobium sp.]